MTDFVGIGDLHFTNHLGKGGLSEYVPETDKMIADLAQQPLNYATKHGIKHIILYGDIFDGPKPSVEGQLALLSLLRQDFEFHIILGNHDKFGPDSDAGHSLQVIQEFGLENVNIYTHTRRVKIGRAKLNFMPWPDQNFLSGYLNVAHVDVAGSKSDSGRLQQGSELSDSEAMAVIGHIHTRQRVRNCFYSGTLYQKNFGEHADKFFHHIQFDGSEFEIIDIPVKPCYVLHNIEVSSIEDLKHVPQSDKDLIKLILLEDCGVVPTDYKHLNVVKTRPVGSATDLEYARLEDLIDGSEVKISSNDFFKEWLRNSNVDRVLKQEAYTLRKKLLS
jgi:DNA repair exonuclease SbcCD nuclease subunit